MTMNPALKWTLKAAVIPAAVVSYVTVAGLTGFCPSCKSLVDSVRGHHEPMTRPAGAVESIRGLVGYTLEAEPTQLSAHIGKPMILEFWATWCGPCHTQRGIIHEMAAELKDRVTLVSLSVDTDPRLVTTFLEKNPSDMLELMAPPELQAALGGISAVPTLVFVDARGTVRGVEAGIHSASRLRARIAELSASTN